MASVMSKQILPLSELVPFDCGVSIGVFVSIMNAARRSTGVKKDAKISIPEAEALRRACSVIESVLLSNIEVVED